MGGVYIEKEIYFKKLACVTVGSLKSDGMGRQTEDSGKSGRLSPKTVCQ